MRLPARHARPSEALDSAETLGSHARLEHYARHEADGLYSLFRRVSGDSHLAADLLQDTLADALKGLGRYDRSRPFTAWIWRIGQNRLRNWLRRRQHERALFCPVRAEELPTESVAEQELMARERWERVEAALGALSPTQRAIVWLRYREERSCREIAEALDKTPNAVSLQLHQARERLRSRLVEACEPARPTAKDEGRA